MAYIPYAPQNGCKYVLVAPSGRRAVFNDPTDADFVGSLTGDSGGVTGLDSAEVRESAEDLVESDGGAHGFFYFGRRPIVITAFVGGHTTLNSRDVRIDKARRVSKELLRADGLLAWQNLPGGSTTAAMQTWVRLQQPMRQTGQWNKELQLPLVSQYAPLFSQSLYTSASTASGTGIVLENKGDAPFYPVARIAGVSTNPTVSDGHGGVFRTTGLSVASGEIVEYDMLNHIGSFTAGARNGQSANRYIDFTLTTAWPFLQSGNNTLTLSGGGTIIVVYRDAWL